MQRRMNDGPAICTGNLNGPSAGVCLIAAVVEHRRRGHLGGTIVCWLGLCSALPTLASSLFAAMPAEQVKPAQKGPKTQIQSGCPAPGSASHPVHAPPSAMHTRQ